MQINWRVEGEPIVMRKDSFVKKVIDGENNKSWKRIFHGIRTERVSKSLNLILESLPRVKSNLR